MIEVCTSQWQAGFIDGLVCSAFMLLLVVGCALGLALSEIRALDKERRR